MTENPLNLYGDRLVSTTGLHGGDISSQRVDELDHCSIDFVAQRRGGGAMPVAVDIGGGHGAQARRMARAGASALLIDLTDQQASAEDFNRELGRSAIRSFKGDVRDIDVRTLCPPLDVIYSQRMMGCIRYAELRDLLKVLFEHANPGARCFLSASGLETEFGLTYPHRDLPVAERWASITPEMAEKHQMYAPECLYRDLELAELVAACGFTVLRAWQSTFGTPKVIAEKL